jgi:hypothetical protein
MKLARFEELTTDVTIVVAGTDRALEKIKNEVVTTKANGILMEGRFVITKTGKTANVPVIINTFLCPYLSAIFPNKGSMKKENIPPIK